jgi:exopolyphosphatase/guanosine-5'-triphosphate,3'-diphosphate pyrophosphatase
MKPRVAVIDVGSNSIKALVAESNGGTFGLRSVYEETLEVRISHGIGGNPPMLQPERIEAGMEAVQHLWRVCQHHGPLQDVLIVATSAVRSAANGHVFMEAVNAVTGADPITLTGAEEADGIAYGVRTDPGIENTLDDFTVFDLGGGSLELIRFEHHGVTDRTSLPLGSVRLTEQFISDSSQAVPSHERDALVAFVTEHITSTGFVITSPLVGCSGGLSALVKVLSERKGTVMRKGRPVFSRSLMDRLTRTILAQDLTGRIKESGLPPRRADIFPAALLTFQAIMDLSGADEIIHSYHNLRYGMAWRMLHNESTA